ncbi:hypothetical protein PR048_010750 [Dryococelus australis]|uniref:Uncharacterized protein n=1 Tax=Dryococelus australis TaxID=614101 RepID=A0ABQ9I4N0_9NEOP|nr:hypothetical protein PR048_010750 [Dryococelus australis]
MEVAHRARRSVGALYGVGITSVWACAIVAHATPAHAPCRWLAAVGRRQSQCRVAGKGKRDPRAARAAAGQ